MPKFKLEKLVSEKLRMVLNGVTILENIRPDWLISSHGEPWLNEILNSKTHQKG